MVLLVVVLWLSACGVLLLLLGCFVLLCYD